MAHLNRLQDPNYVVELKAYREQSRWSTKGAAKPVSVLRITGFERSFQVDDQSDRG